MLQKHSDTYPFSGGIRYKSGSAASIPFVSIITVVYNSISTIEETIRSIISKKSFNIEYIIIDGNSTDGTVEIIKKYDSQIDYWISEPDNGIYEAMNKGWQAALGTYINYLNTGDLLLEVPLKELDDCLQHNVILASFSVKLTNGSIHLPTLDQTLKIRNTLHHQGSYYRRTLPYRYDITFKVFADFDLNQRLLLANEKITIYPDIIVATHDINGISHNKTYINEIYQVVRKNFGNFYMFLSFLQFKMDGIKRRLKI